MITHRDELAAAEVPQLIKTILDVGQAIQIIVQDDRGGTGIVIVITTYPGEEPE